MPHPLLQTIATPKDLRSLSRAQLKTLASAKNPGPKLLPLYTLSSGGNLTTNLIPCSRTRNRPISHRRLPNLETIQRRRKDLP